MYNKKVTVNETTGVVTVVEATLGDVVSTLFNSDEAVTGAYALLQKALIIGGAAMFANAKHTGSATNFGTRA